MVDGAEVPIETGFRAWLDFQRILSEEGLCDPSVLLAEPPAGADWRPAAVAFLNARPSTPRGERRGPRSVDLFEDADYLVGAFQQAYGIDLTDDALDMHWHRFLALFRSLPASTKLAEIAGYRTWDRAEEKRGHESRMAELKRMWALPERKGPADREIVDMQMRWFGDVTGVRHG